MWDEGKRMRAFVSEKEGEKSIEREDTGCGSRCGQSDSYSGFGFGLDVL